MVNPRFACSEPSQTSSAAMLKPVIFFVIVLATLIGGCTSSTSVDQERLEVLQSDPMARYRPQTGELIDSHEEAGARVYNFDHGWEESAGVVVNRWRIAATREEVAGDVIDALTQSDWTDVTENQVGEDVVIRAHKPHDGYCIRAFVTISEVGGGRVDQELTAPYSGSDDDGCPDEQ